VTNVDRNGAFQSSDQHALAARGPVPAAYERGDFATREILLYKTYNLLLHEDQCQRMRGEILLQDMLEESNNLKETA
jgi:hypothetical protein